MGFSDSPAHGLAFYLGQRLSYDGALCTVRYHGSLPGTKGVWLGVEWDDVNRGKHDGTHQGKRYFDCLSSAPTAGSFIRPSRIPDPPRSFLDALRFKYAAEDTNQAPFPSHDAANGKSMPNGSVIEISGKVVEEVGFERIRQQQAVLRNLRIVLLDQLCLKGITLEPHDPAAIAAAQEAVTQTCPDLVELDLGWNLIETWTDVAEICLPLKRLQVLKASGLRLRQFDLPRGLEEKQPFRHVTELYLNETLVRSEQIRVLIHSLCSGRQRFPVLKLLSIGQNCLSHLQNLSHHDAHFELPSVTTLMLDYNLFTSLAFLPNVMHAFPNLKALSLQGNQISSIGLLPHIGSDRKAVSFPRLGSLNLSHNLIADYAFIDALPQVFPGLTSLRVSNNPLFSLDTSTHPPASDQIPHKATLTSSTASALPHHISTPPRMSRPDAPYSLTLARIPSLLSLNHSTITSRDREEGEIYYLSIAERELSAAIAETTVESRERLVSVAKRQYPRYEELCRKYERESVFDKMQSAPKETAAQSSYAPGTLGVRLVKTHFYIPQNEEGAGATSNAIPTTFSRLIPRTISVYTLKALLARIFSLPALQFRLIYESPELDPVVAPRDGNDRANWDTWGDWDLDHPPKDPDAAAKQGKKWKKREVEILDGTREWGFYIEDGVMDATIRMEPLKHAEREVGEG